MDQEVLRSPSITSQLDGEGEIRTRPLPPAFGQALVEAFAAPLLDGLASPPSLAGQDVREFAGRPARPISTDIVP